LFKRGHAHHDQPRTEPYLGDLEELHRHYEFPHHEIGQHTTIYHSGTYDKIPAAKTEERVEMTPTLKGLIVIFS
jgi:hypothetical protein